MMTASATASMLWPTPEPYTFFTISALASAAPRVPKVSVHLRNSSLGLRISGYRLIAHILDLIPDTDS